MLSVNFKSISPSNCFENLNVYYYQRFSNFLVYCWSSQFSLAVWLHVYTVASYQCTEDFQCKWEKMSYTCTVILDGAFCCSLNVYQINFYLMSIFVFPHVGASIFFSLAKWLDISVLLLIIINKEKEIVTLFLRVVQAP